MYIYIYIHYKYIYIYVCMYMYIYIYQVARSTLFFKQHLATSDVAKDLHVFKPPTSNLSHSTQHQSAKVSVK